MRMMMKPSCVQRNYSIANRIADANIIPPLTFFLFDESLIDYLDYSYAICVSFELLFFYVRLLSL